MLNSRECGEEGKVMSKLRKYVQEMHSHRHEQCCCRDLAQDGRRCNYHAALLVVLAGIDEIERLTTWQPMKTAPRDGTEVLLRVAYRAGSPGKCLVGHYMPGGYCVEDQPAIDEGWYFWTGCMFNREAKPIAWMPIPEVTSADAVKDVK